MTSWDDAIKEAGEAKAGGDFIRLQNDGESVIVAFVGPPTKREVCWIDGKSEIYDPTIHPSSEKKTRWLVNCWCKSDETMRIFEGSGQWMENSGPVIKNMHGKYFFELKRSGVGMKTKYPVVPTEEITEEYKAKIEATDPHDLDRFARPRDDMPF